MNLKESATVVNEDKMYWLRQGEIWLCMALAATLHMSLTVSWIFLILGFVLTALLPDLPGRFMRLLRAPLTMPLVVFTITVAVSALANGGMIDAGQIFANVRSFLIYFYIYQAFVAGENGCEERTLATFIAVGAVAGLYGAFQQIFNFHPGTYPYLQATGFLQAPMPFAGIMQMTSFLALGIYLSKGYTILPGVLKDKRFFALMVLANFAGLFFSAERSAWLGMIAGIFALTLRLKPQALIKVILIGCIALTLGWFYVPAVQARLAPLLHPEKDIGVSTRIKIWKRAEAIFIEHPLLGIGPSHFPSIKDIPEALVPGRSSDLNHAHSNYFQILATLGIVGFLAFMALQLIALFSAFKQSKDGSWSGGVGLGIFAALISLMVAGLFEYNFGAGQVKLAQWFLLGALRNENSDGNDGDDEED